MLPMQSKAGLLACGYSAFILIACLIHAAAMIRFAPSLKTIFEMDKLAHFLAFAGFAVMWVRVAPSVRQVVKVALMGVAFGVGIEVIQWAFKAGSDVEVRDILADVAGLAVGLILWTLYDRIRVRARADATREEQAGSVGIEMKECRQ